MIIRIDHFLWHLSGLFNTQLMNYLRNQRTVNDTCFAECLETKEASHASGLNFQFIHNFYIFISMCTEVVLKITVY